MKNYRGTKPSTLHLRYSPLHTVGRETTSRTSPGRPWAAAARMSMGENGCEGLPFSAYCAYSRSCARRSQVGGALAEHRECAMRLHCSQSTALFLTLCRQTLQMTAGFEVSE